MEDNPCPWCGEQVEREPETFTQYNMDWHEPCFWTFAAQEATFNWASRYFRSLSLSSLRYFRPL